MTKPKCQMGGACLAGSCMKPCLRGCLPCGNTKGACGWNFCLRRVLLEWRTRNAYAILPPISGPGYLACQRHKTSSTRIPNGKQQNNSAQMDIARWDVLAHTCPELDLGELSARHEAGVCVQMRGPPRWLAGFGGLPLKPKHG